MVTSELIKCRECGLVFGQDEALICSKCLEHICPKCGSCGCSPQPDFSPRRRLENRLR